jgi:hypothetical protein
VRAAAVLSALRAYPDAAAHAHALASIAPAPAHFSVPSLVAPLHHATVGARLLRRAMEQGSVGAVRTLGDWALAGVGLAPGRGDPLAAVGLYKAASELRDAESSFNLGWLYEAGWSGPGATAVAAAAAATATAATAPTAGSSSSISITSPVTVGQDLALARRYYDLAAQQSAAAALPVELALWGLWARERARAVAAWWQRGADWREPAKALGEFVTGSPGTGPGTGGGAAGAAAATPAAVPAAMPAAAAAAAAAVDQPAQQQQQPPQQRGRRGRRESNWDLLQRLFRDVYMPYENVLLAGLVVILAVVMVLFRGGGGGGAAAAPA